MSRPYRKSWIARLLFAVALWSLTTHVRAADQPLVELEEQAIKAAVERVAPSVVRIETVGGLERVGELLVGTGPTTGLWSTAKATLSQVRLTLPRSRIRSS